MNLTPIVKLSNAINQYNTMDLWSNKVMLFRKASALIHGEL